MITTLSSYKVYQIFHLSIKRRDFVDFSKYVCTVNVDIFVINFKLGLFMNIIL